MRRHDLHAVLVEEILNVRVQRVKRDHPRFRTVQAGPLIQMPIFVGLWPPFLWLVGDALERHE